LAKFRHAGRDINLGHYDEPETAARVVDFARYLCFGLNPANWHINVGRPNFPPCVRNDFSRVDVVAKLLHQAKVSPSLLQTRLVEHDRAALEHAVAGRLRKPVAVG
jgi:hypothetical protein